MIKKIKIIPTLIVIGIALLIGYTFFAANNTEWQKWLMFGLSSIEFLIFLEVAFGIELESRKAINLIIVSIIFIIIALIDQILFSILRFTMAPYIIVNGILSLTFIGIVYSLSKTEV